MGVQLVRPKWPVGDRAVDTLQVVRCGDDQNPLVLDEADFTRWVTIESISSMMRIHEANR